MYDLLNQRERRNNDHVKIPKKIADDLNQLLSDLAYFDFPYAKDDTFKLAETEAEWWKPTTSNYWNNYYNQYQGRTSGQFSQECKKAVNNYKESVNNVEARFRIMINITQVKRVQIVLDFSMIFQSLF